MIINNSGQSGVATFEQYANLKLAVSSNTSDINTIKNNTNTNAQNIGTLQRAVNNNTNTIDSHATSITNNSNALSNIGSSFNLTLNFSSNPPQNFSWEAITNSTDMYLITKNILSNAINKNFLVDCVIDESDIYSEIKQVETFNNTALRFTFERKQEKGSLTLQFISLGDNFKLASGATEVTLS